MRYFAGESYALGVVTCLPQQSFPALCAEVLWRPIRLPLSRAQFFALPKRDKEGTADQQRAKRVRYITPAVFKKTPSDRVTEEAIRCNLIALDIDDSVESRRLLKQDWQDCLRDLGFVVWRTVSSTDEAPRLRVLVHADGIPVDRYPQAVRTIAEMIGLTAVTHESRVVVQPMFLPTVFVDDPQDSTPIVAINADGDPFRAADILGDEDSSLVDASPALGSTEVADIQFLRAPLEGVTLEDAKQAMSFLDPDLPMQQWIEVAAGLKHQFSSQEGDAFKLWDEWSAKGKKYVDHDETQYRWRTLKANPVDRAPVTIRSVFKLAMARGWASEALSKRHYQETLQWIRNGIRATEQLMDEGPKRIAKVGALLGHLERKSLMIALKDVLAGRAMPIPVADIKKAVRQMEIEAVRTTGTPPWTKGLCYVTSLNLFYRHTTDRRFIPDVLDMMYSTMAMSDEQALRPRDVALQLASIPQVENLRYEPSAGGKRFFTDAGVPYVNTYRPDYAAPVVETAAEAGAIYWDHVLKLLGSEEYARMLTSYLAYMVKCPGKKVRWAPLIQSGEGAGKTALHAMMVACLGRRNTAKLRGSDVMEGTHNDWAYGHQLVTIEEVRIVGANRHAVMDKLKPCISDDDLNLHVKYENHRTVSNCTNYLMFTNYQDALAIQEDGRRYYVLASPLQRPEHIRAMGGKEHFNKVYRMIRENPGGLRAWFEMWEFDKNFEPEGRAPVTPFLYQFAENAATPLTTAVKQAIEDEPHPLVRRDLISLACLRACMDSGYLQNFSDQAISGVLREQGWDKYGRVTIAGAKHHLWGRGEFADVRSVAESRLKWL